MWDEFRSVLKTALLRLAARKGPPLTLSGSARVNLQATSSWVYCPSSQCQRHWRFETASCAARRQYTTSRVIPGHSRTTVHAIPIRYNQRPRNAPTTRALNRRSFFTDNLPTVLVPPTVFILLLLTLWTYKCVMTVVFQDKIIYMPYIGRSETMEKYAPDCKPVEWEQKNIKSLDGTRIALCVGSLPPKEPRASRHIVICYFQGNGSSPPPRMPLLSNVLKSIEFQAKPSNSSVHYTIVSLSYRGYWKSSGRASQPGIEKDAQALLQWVNSTYATPDVELQLVLWGQSIGAGVASTAAAEYIQDTSLARKAPIAGLVLETPFTSIKSMLIGLYPQKWLPYQYLWPFLWNFWDSEVALRRIAEAEDRFKILLVSATRDEVVPPGEADKLEKLCRELKLETERKDVIGALHTEATTRREGQDAVARFAIEVAGRDKRKAQRGD